MSPLEVVKVVVFNQQKHDLGYFLTDTCKTLALGWRGKRRRGSSEAGTRYLYFSLGPYTGRQTPARIKDTPVVQFG